MDDVRWWQRQYEIQGKRLAELEAENKELRQERDDLLRVRREAEIEMQRLRGTTE